MSEDQNKYKFDNLQPITFLRKFNKMIEEDQKIPLKAFKNELKVFPLSKFPLPKFYQKMQGIFETGTKKKDVINLNIKSKDDIQDQQFMAKHRNFMTKAIQNIIQDNQNQQNSYQNYKVQYKSREKTQRVVLKARSQPKIHHQIKLLHSITKNQNAKQTPPIQKSINQTDIQTPEEPVRSYMQQVQFQRMQSLKNVKKQKIRIRDDNKLSSFLQQRRNCMSQRNKNIKSNLLSQIKTGRTQYNSISAQDWKKSFMQGLLDLQKQQNAYQKKYSDKIQKQIKKFDEKIKTSVEKTNNQKFW